MIGLRHIAAVLVLALPLAAAAGAAPTSTPPSTPPGTEAQAAPYPTPTSTSTSTSTGEEAATPAPETTPAAFAGAPDLEDVGSGPFARAEIGTLIFTGAPAAAATPGVAYVLSAGYAPFEFLELAGVFVGGMASVDGGFGPPPPGTVELVGGGAEARFCWTFSRLRASIGAGAAMLDLGPDLLLDVEEFGGVRRVGAGVLMVEYAAFNPHFSAGVTGRWLHDAAAPGAALVVAAGTLQYRF